MVRKYYSPTLKAWLGDLEDGKHDGGPEDPRIGVIKVVAKTVTYAISDGTILGRGVEIAKGTVTGSTPKVNKLREIREQELEQCKSRLSLFGLHPVRKCDLFSARHGRFVCAVFDNADTGF